MNWLGGKSVVGDHAKLPQVRKFSPMEACFLAVEPHL
jgi:hypothetical protein